MMNNASSIIEIVVINITDYNITHDRRNDKDNISSIGGYDWSLRDQAALVVLMDMSLAILSVVFNLIVITSVKEKEDMLRTTFNLVLINLCSSNLLSCVMVKSISIVHNAYAVVSNSTESDIAFCILYSFGFRLTWSVLPWSVVALTWLTAIPRLKRLQVSYLLKCLPCNPLMFSP